MNGLSIEERFLPYVASLEARPVSAVDLVVIHCTELPDLETARQYGEKIVYPESRTGNSGHYYLERTGRIEQWVPLDRCAHHVRGYNTRSVGVELCNLGRYPEWLNSGAQSMTEPYPDVQIQSLIKLLRALRNDLPNLRWICGHDRLDTRRVASSDDLARSVRRRLDPGPLFPWRQVLAVIELDQPDRIGKR